MAQKKDAVTIAAVATQKVILEEMEKSDIEPDDFISGLSAGGEPIDISSWEETPSMTYAQFLRACSLLHISATRMFALTKERLTGKKTIVETHQESNGIGDDLPPLPDVEVDSSAAGIKASGDVLLRWSSIIELIVHDTGKTVEQIRGLFAGTPRPTSATSVDIPMTKKSEKARAVALGLLRNAINKIGIVDADKLDITLVDADS